MERNTDPVVVLGAAGAIGSHVVDALMARGRPVRAVTRTSRPHRAGVESVVADLLDPAALRAAAADATVIVHAAQPAYTRWAAEFPALTSAIADAATGARLVFADNLYSCGPVDGPLTEELPAAAVGVKGRVRSRMAQELLQRDQDVVIARMSDYYGPRGLLSTAGSTLFEPAIAGRMVRLIGSADQPHTWHYLPDVGRALVELADAPQATGRVWHVPAADPLTQRELVAAVAAAAGVPPRVSVLPGPLHAALAMVHPMLRELRETRYQFAAPFVVDASRFTREIGPFEPTPHATAVAATVDWFRAAA